MCKTRVCNEKRTLVGERILFYYSEKKQQQKNSCGTLQHCMGVAGGGGGLHAQKRNLAVYKTLAVFEH